MKLFGYSNNTKLKPMELSEVTLSANPETLREISKFLLRCAEEIENSKEQWEHEHFSSNNKNTSPTLIVFNEEATNE